MSDDARGHGLGKKLLGKSLQFCDHHAFKEIHLWTVQGLDTARSMYEKNGFSLAEKYIGDQWGSEIVEQKFIRCHPTLK